MGNYIPTPISLRLCLRLVFVCLFFQNIFFYVIGVNLYKLHFLLSHFSFQSNKKKSFHFFMRCSRTITFFCHNSNVESATYYFHIGLSFCLYHSQFATLELQQSCGPRFSHFASFQPNTYKRKLNLFYSYFSIPQLFSIQILFHHN